MKRLQISERPDWRETAEKLGFIFHTMYGEPYWDETVCYEFSLRQIEDDIEDPTAELHAMCLDLVDRVVGNEDLLTMLAIPEAQWDAIGASWAGGPDHRAPSLYGRFDLAYSGEGPAKMLEYNADTPTSLYETAYFQWNWLEDYKARTGRGDLDQFNSVQDALIDRFGDLFERGSHIHFAAAEGSDEDRATVRYLEDCALQAGMIPHFILVDDIGVDADGRFVDKAGGVRSPLGSQLGSQPGGFGTDPMDGHVIEALFKLYPWEDMMREEYAPYLGGDTVFLEPLWKAILSNKAMLPLLWRFNRGHPNLLPAAFEGSAEASDIGADYVRKPIFSREGANVSIIRGGATQEAGEGDYGEEGFILQAYHPLPVFDGNHTVIGSWIIGDEACGMSLREDTSPVTKDLSRFIPHVFVE